MTKEQATKLALYLEKRNLWVYVCILRTNANRTCEPPCFIVQCWKKAPDFIHGSALQSPGKVYTEYPEFMKKEEQ